MTVYYITDKGKRAMEHWRGKGKLSGGRHTGEWIYGVNPVIEALRAGRKIMRICVSSGMQGWADLLRREAEKRSIPIDTLEPSFFDSSFPKGHQGVAARVSPKRYVPLTELLAIPEVAGEAPLFLVLDCLEDPRNFGAVLRTADAAGVHGVVIQAHRSVGIVPEISKASAGAVEYVPVSLVPNIKHAINEMREKGITVIGAEAGNRTMLWDIDLTIPICLVIGSEGRGMRKTVREYCDVLAGIPMRGRIGSLNVSVAAGILLFEVVRQRLKKPKYF
jgi:23S rRNA (guanosine2251-2'-O)-methyltransferase